MTFAQRIHSTDMSDFAFTHNNRWIGNYVFSIFCILVLFAFSIRKSRPTWLAGAALFVTVFVILFLSAAVMDHLSPMTTVGWGPRFTHPLLLTWFSAMPIQEVCNLVLGEDNVFEEHFMIPTALLMWAIVGAALGCLKAKFGSGTPKMNP